MKAGPGKVIIKIANVMQDRIVFPSGVTIFTDFQNYADGDRIISNTNDYLTTNGEVVAIPDSLGGRETLLAENGKLITANRLPIDVRVGDTIHFNYLANDYKKAFYHDGNLLYPVMVDDIFATERDGNIIAQGGKVLIIPSKKQVVQSTLIEILDQFLKEDPNVGILKYKWKPIYGDPPTPAEVEDKVCYRQDVAATVTIDNIKYDVVYEREILAVIRKG